MSIRQLTPEVAAKIAAGEVVERPASVVKELVENALDAGARMIRVELRGGGLDLIRVSDDGVGIPAEELPLAFARHATSKIGALDDLERIRTLGFRGEALASIASVARVSVTSRTRATPLGAQLEMDEGALGALTTVGAPAGTSVAVRNLFASVPARLKFLKTRSTETGHALRLIEQYALAYPETRFTALSEERQVFHSPGDGALFSALVAVYGLRVAEAMIALPLTDERDSAALDDARPVGPDDPPRVTGYISRPSNYKATRHFLSFFVNRRWVQSRTLSFAVEEAYHSLLLPGRHPIVALNIALDPALYDANVHPAKTEVRFLRERQVFVAVQRAVRGVLLRTAETPDIAATAFSIPTWGRPNERDAAPPQALAPGDTRRDSLPDGALVASPPIASPRMDATTARDALNAQQTAQRLLWRGELPSHPAAPMTTPDASGFQAPGVAAATAPVGGAKLPVLRVLGQVSQSYIITEGPDGMYLVDQHAAHERILLERMIADWRARAVSAQLLLEPLPIELTAIEREAIEDHLDALSAIGFAIEPFGGDALLVRAIPAPLASQARAQPIRELLLELAGADDAAASHGETWEEHALANVACKAAIKAGQTLSPQEQRELIAQLEQVDAHQSCCHGRPTMVHLSLSSLERQFERR